MPSTDHEHRSEGPRTERALLDPRKAAILEAVVTEYIGTAQPVGSQHVAQAAGGRGLVGHGALARWSRSSTRATWSSPTPVPGGSRPTRATASSSTTWPSRASSVPAQRQKVSRFFDQVHGEMEEMLERTSGLLSELTSLRRGRGRARATSRRPSARSSWSASGPAWPCSSWCWPTAPSRSAPSSSTDDVGDEVLAGGHGPAPGRLPADGSLADRGPARAATGDPAGRPGARRAPPPPWPARRAPTRGRPRLRRRPLPAGRRPSTPSRRCARCSASSSSRWSW